MKNNKVGIEFLRLFQNQKNTRINPEQFIAQVRLKNFLKCSPVWVIGMILLIFTLALFARVGDNGFANIVGDWIVDSILKITSVGVAFIAVALAVFFNWEIGINVESLVGEWSCLKERLRKSGMSEIMFLNKKEDMRLLLKADLHRLVREIKKSEELGQKRKVLRLRLSFKDKYDLAKDLGFQLSDYKSFFECRGSRLDAPATIIRLQGAETD